MHQDIIDFLSNCTDYQFFAILFSFDDKRIDEEPKWIFLYVFTIQYFFN